MQFMAIIVGYIMQNDYICMEMPYHNGTIL